MATSIVFPILCGIPRTACKAPAIKVTREDGSSAVFPLTRSEMGVVWRSENDMKPWVEERRLSDWKGALKLFRDLVDYPSAFLSVLLQVFRSGRFHDGSFITSDSWKADALSDVSKVVMCITCSRCGRAQEAPVSFLHKTSGVTQRLRCSLFGERCSDRHTATGSSSEEDGLSEGSRRPRECSLLTVTQASRSKSPPWRTWRDNQPEAQTNRDAARQVLTLGPLETTDPMRSSFAFDSVGHVSASHFILGKLASRLSAPGPYCG